MKNIYILDEYFSSTQNGIGTFLQELTACFKDENICLIEFNSKEKSFCLKSDKPVKEMHFPPFFQNGFLANHKIIDKFFRLYIEDSPDNLFMLNHSPCEELLKAIKTSFPLSKVTFTIHDLGWTSNLAGNLEWLKSIVSKENRKKTKEKYRGILDYFHEEQRMYEIADRVVCLSQDTYQVLQEVYEVQKEKICLIPNGLTDSVSPVSNAEKKALKKKMQVNPEEKIILIVGRVSHAKGATNLLSAFETIVRKYSNCRLAVVGTVYDPSLILNLSKNVASRVSYTGLINKNELNRWYQIADIGVMPSFSEQCSYTGIEMMMHGLPVVASDGFGVRNMFQDGVNARIAPIGDRKKPKEFSKNLANAILELLFSDELCSSLGKAARNIYETRYLPEKMQTGYVNLLKTLYD
jgi:glycosyltransferase